jgi:hypothetical protein
MVTLGSLFESAARSTVRALGMLFSKKALFRGITELRAVLAAKANGEYWDVWTFNRDKAVDKATYLNEPALDSPEFSVLIQGPLTSGNCSKVMETISFYLRVWPQCEIVLSTWEGTDSHRLALAVASMHRVHMVISPDPGNSYPQNIIRQAVSVSRGLDFIEENQLPNTIWKTRVDQRVEEIGAPLMVSRLLQTFDHLKSARIIVSSYGTGRFRVFGATDQLQFGTLYSMQLFWQGVEGLLFSDGIQGKDCLLREMSAHVQEVRLNTRFINRAGGSVDWTWDAHLSSMRDFFCVIDSYAIKHRHLGRYFTKYDHVSPLKRDYQNAFEEHLSFADWLRIWEGKFYDHLSTRDLLAATKSPKLLEGKHRDGRNS